MRNVTITQLRLLRAAAHRGSLAAAAEECHVTPSAVTMQMHQLETVVGLPLIERQGRRFTLTAAGREVFAAAERIEAVLADCTAGLAALKTLASGRVTVGVVSTAKYFAPQMLATFARAPPEGVRVESALIGDHPQVIIAPPDHPLAKQRSISPREIAKQTILMREVGSGTRLLAEKFLAEHDIEPRIGMEIGSNETIKQAVMAGLGIAFISAHTIAAEIDDGRLAILDVEGLPDIRQWFVVRPAAKRMMPAARSLRDFLVAEGRRFLPTVKHYRRVAKRRGRSDGRFAKKPR